MFEKKSLDFLKKLLNASGPSGYEIETAKVYRDYLAGFADEVSTDVMGNTMGVINKKAKLKVMLAGHYDEIGFQIVHISDEGLLYIRAVGGIDKLTVPGTEVEVLVNGKRVAGIIGKKPIHLLTPEERNKAVEIKDMWVDLGVDTKKDAEKKVSVGDFIAVKSNYSKFGKYRIKSKGMDDKIGAFVVAEVLRELSKRKINVAVYAVGTVQEELGLRGATTSSFDINPDVGFAVDVGFATDTPTVSKSLMGDVSLGKGAIVAKNADNNIVLGSKIRRVAKENKIDIQETAGHRASGGTDTATMQLSRNGTATALISIPNRYMHTAVEMCDLRDAESAIKLITETIATFAKDEEFIPGIN